MNERIKQLAIKAGVSSLWMSGTDQQGNPILEKFAELIVQECALQCNHDDDMDRILEYFGVEE